MRLKTCDGVREALGGYQGQAFDIFIHAEETRRTKDQIIRLYAKHCGRTYEDVERTLDRDRFMTPQEARDWRLIDEIPSERDRAA